MTPDTSLFETFGFLDFEASSLSLDSWPIEMGLSRLLSNGLVITESFLIQPHPTWNLHDWNAESEAVHNIPLAELNRSGTKAEQAAERFCRWKTACLLVSDAPHYETRWAWKLLTTLPEFQDRPQRPLFHSMDRILANTLKENGLHAAWAFLDAQKIPHRAGPDSALMALALKEGLVADGHRFTKETPPLS